MHCSKTAAAKLEKLNKRTLRSNIFNDYTSTNTLPERANNTVYSAQPWIKDMCILIYKVIHRTTPCPLFSFLTVRSTTCSSREKWFFYSLGLIPTNTDLILWGIMVQKCGIFSLTDKLKRTSLTLKMFVTRIQKMTYLIKNSTHPS